MTAPLTGRVSVLSPSFNQARFLPANLESVRGQGPLVREHIIVDGGSRDGSVEVLRRQSDPKVRWISEPDRGQSDALNKALAMSSGDIIGWLNSDDMYCPGAVARAVALLDAEPDLGMVYGHCHQVDAEGRVLGRVTAEEVDFEGLLSYATIPQPSCFLRRSVLEAAGGLDVRYLYAMDYDLWLRIGLRGFRWRAVDEYWACFRLHSRSKTVSQAARFDPEVERAMDETLRSPLLPEALRARSREIRRRFHTGVALAAYSNLRLGTVRRHVHRAVAVDARHVDARLIKVYAKSLLGGPILSALRRAKEAVIAVP